MGTGVLSRGCSRTVKLTIHIHLLTRLGMSGAIPPTPSASLYSTAPLVPQLVEDVPALYGSPLYITLLHSEPGCNWVVHLPTLFLSHPPYHLRLHLKQVYSGNIFPSGSSTRFSLPTTRSMSHTYHLPLSRNFVM